MVFEDLSDELSEYFYERAKLSDEEIDQGLIIIRKHRVKTFANYKVEVRNREHPPPHFHVTGPDVSASFTIVDLRLLDGQIGRHEEKILRRWYNTDGGKERLIHTWNKTRPTDCAVGPIR